MNKSWSILLFGVGAVLLALTFIKGAPAWNALSGWLFGLFGVITYAVAPVVLYLAVLIAAGRPAKAKLWQGALLLCFASALALIFSRLDLSGGKLWETFLSLGAAGQELRGGGLLSALIGWPLLALCGRPAANVIIVVVVVMFFMLLTSTTPVDIYRFFREKASGARGRFDEYERNAAAARAAREERRRREMCIRDRIGLVDAGKADRDDGADAQIQRHQGRVLPAGTLAVVGAAHDDAPVCGQRPVVKGRVTFFKTEVGDLGDIAAERQHLGAGGHDVVGGDVVAHFQQHRQRHAVLRHHGLGQRLDIGAAQDLHLLVFRLRGGHRDHVVVQQIALRQRRFFDGGQGGGVGEIARQRAGGRGLRADQIDAGILRAAAALEIAVKGAQRHPLAVGGEAHADTGAAGGFQDAGARVDEVGQRAVCLLYTSRCV